VAWDRGAAGRAALLRERIRRAAPVIEDAEQGPAPIDLLHQHVLIGGRADLVGELAEVGTGRHQAAGDQQQG